MNFQKANVTISVLLVLLTTLSACGPLPDQPSQVTSSTPRPSPGPTHTLTPRPSFTLRPTDTPNLTATQKIADLRTATQAFFDARDAETQKYYELGYLATTNGTNRQYADFVEEWAQLGWYSWRSFENHAENFYVSAHFKWSSAYRNADLSGCGIVFAIQENNDKYSVFLDRSGILFYIYEESYGYYRPVGITRGTGKVEFGNPFDEPVEADFTLIVKDAYAYVLVNGELTAEYTLSKNKFYKGGFGPAILSGTNKDFGTRCEITNFHGWVQSGL
ncbi:MAG TPA: hypothetical protein VFR47_24500 [Anaerolineales bacterium]|nr:hypothetical protein [Anaerolineales bacterium]